MGRGAGGRERVKKGNVSSPLAWKLYGVKHEANQGMGRKGRVGREGIGEGKGREMGEGGKVYGRGINRTVVEERGKEEDKRERKMVEKERQGR